MGEYGHGKSFFPKEIIYVVIAAVILFGAGMIFGPHLLSAINSGANTVANPVEVPKAGDTGQLPAVVNETMESYTDCCYAKGLKIEKSTLTVADVHKKIRPGILYYQEINNDPDLYGNPVKAMVLVRKEMLLSEMGITITVNGVTISNLTAVEAGDRWLNIFADVNNPTKKITEVTITAYSDWPPTQAMIGGGMTAKKLYETKNQVYLKGQVDRDKVKYFILDFWFSNITASK